MKAGKRLRQAIKEAGGLLTAERFMEEALYHPQYGYYLQQIRTVGRRGDFSTAATLHPALGRAIARWSLFCRQEVAPRGPWHLIEIGGGNGQLAQSVLQAIPWWSRRKLRYHLVEVSPLLRQQQEAHLAGFPVLWHSTLISALKEAQGRALLFSNELVDAFPCLVLLWQEGRWKEVALTLEQGQVEERFLDLPEQRLASLSCSALEWTAPPQGQRIEIHAAYHDWMAEGLPHWQTGSWLTIDYGDSFPHLYHRRPAGTWRAYFQHLRLEGEEIYQRMGQQDLTADVNFTDLDRWGQKWGLHLCDLSTQGDFLRTWLPEVVRHAPHHRPKTSPTGMAPEDAALAYLLDRQGMGSAYRVLWQKR